MFYVIARNIIFFIVKIVFRIKIHGKENIPQQGGCILCANHINFLDAVTMVGCTKRQVHLIGKKELFQSKIFGAIFLKLGAFPVDRQSSMDIKAYRTAINILKNEKILGIFFEGTRHKSLEEDGGKSGVAFFALKGKAPIIPIKISGKYKPFVSKLNVYIGKPLSYEEYYNQKVEKETLKQIVNELTEVITSLDEKYN